MDLAATGKFPAAPHNKSDQPLVTATTTTLGANRATNRPTDLPSSGDIVLLSLCALVEIISGWLGLCLAAVDGCLWQKKLKRNFN